MNKINLLWIIVLIFILMSMFVSAGWNADVGINCLIIVDDFEVGRGGENLNDANNATKFSSDIASPHPHWVNCDFGVGNSEQIERLGVDSQFDGQASVKDWDFYGSTDNSSWVLLKSAQHPDVAEGPPLHSLFYTNFTNAISYRYYLFNITSSWYQDITVIWEFTMFTSDIPAAPPTNSSWNITSLNLLSGENSSVWNAGGVNVINITNNTLSLAVTTSVASNGSCAIGKDLNYTAMVADNINYKFATTETTSHSYLVYDNISVGNHCLYCSFIDAAGREFANSSSGCLNLTRTKSITGYVFDSLSNIIVGARVYITNLFTNITESVITNADGIYESNSYYQTGIHKISGYEPGNFTENPDAQLVNVTE